MIINKYNSVNIKKDIIKTNTYLFVNYKGAGTISWDSNNYFRIKPVFQTTIYNSSSTNGNMISTANQNFYFTTIFSELQPLYEINNSEYIPINTKITDLTNYSIVKNNFSTLGKTIENEIKNKVASISNASSLEIVSIYRINSNRVFINFKINTTNYRLEIVLSSFEII